MGNDVKNEEAPRPMRKASHKDVINRVDKYERNESASIERQNLFDTTQCDSCISVFCFVKSHKMTTATTQPFKERNLLAVMGDEVETLSARFEPSLNALNVGLGNWALAGWNWARRLQAQIQFPGRGFQ